MNNNRKLGGGFVILVLAGVAAAMLASRPARANSPWYVTTTGNDANDCLSPATPCGMINGAIGKAASGDTVYVAMGTYTSSTGSEVVLINKSVTLSGGWDGEFNLANSVSTLDGQKTRMGIRVESGAIVNIERFKVQNGDGFPYNYDCGGIYNMGILTLTHSIIQDSVRHGDVYDSPGIINQGTLTINSSSIIRNAGQGIISYGTLNTASVIINNSTISLNSAKGLGGGIRNDTNSTTEIYNSSIIGNSGDSATVSPPLAFGGGISNFWGGLVILQNSILVDNKSIGISQDCMGPISSAGFNLVGNTSQCSFAAASGDLQNIVAHVTTIGPYIGLLPNSPAIDAGDPTGCKDHQGNPITTDQRGTIRPLDGNNDGDARCDIGAYEYDPANPIRQVFLPSITRNYCPDFFDDFSNPASGWSVRDDAFVRSEYLNGEYRMLSKQSGYFYFSTSPGCERQNYVVETDARWEGAPGDSYGLRFGITSDFSQYYLFDMNTDYQLFRVLRRSPSGWATVVPVTASGAIHTGSTSNHLKVTRNGSQITLEVNGAVLGTWYEATIGGLTQTGLMFSPLDTNPTADARFDNFRVSGLPSSAIVMSPPPSQAAVVAPFSTEKLDERPTLQWLIPSSWPEVNQQ